MAERTDFARAQAVDVAAFEGAWQDFALACSRTVAPEATYQAWLAAFAMERLELLRVVREVDFGARHLGPDAVKVFTGSNLMVDLLVLREPVVNLPRRAALAREDLPDGAPNPRSGLGRLRDFSVLTELKVSSSQMGGLGVSEVLRDFRKLSAILDAAECQYPDHPLPAAYVGVLDNHPNSAFNFGRLERRITEAGIRSDVGLLKFSVARTTPG